MVENSDALSFIRIGYGNQLHVIDHSRLSSTVCGRWYPPDPVIYSGKRVTRYFDGICQKCQKGLNK